MNLVPGETIDAGYQHPRDPLEIWLARQWQHILGFPVGIRESFFGIGGNSLDAALVIDVILQEFGVQLPLKALIDHPTVERLAALLRAMPHAEPALAGPLVTIQDGDGTRPPLYLVHPGNGQAGPYCQLAHDLGEEYPVTAIQAAGLYTSAQPRRTVPAMAAAYAAAIRAARPAGPCLLGGSGIGAAIAYEMAARLGNVPLLAAIAPALLQPPAPGQPPGQPGQQHDPAPPGTAPELAARSQAVRQACQDALRDWQPSPYTGPLDTFGAPPATALPATPLPATVTQRPHPCATHASLADALRQLLADQC